ncbi:chemotaxis response regulator protein-glutamate methylesterase [Ignavibacteria bacterium]|nr:chemotaxis response regulator protein-glutamate methylesterase [Bacteroidota bacterium]
MEKIRVLIVDDSVFMRQTLKKMLSAESDIEVVDVARNGQDAIEKIKRLNPDLVTMDVEMPVMSGIDALRIIMKDNPLPVLMVSAVTSEGAQQTLDALALGAVDFITKRSAFGTGNDSTGFQEELIGKIRNIGGNALLRSRLRRRRGSVRPTTERTAQSPTQAHASHAVSTRSTGRKRLPSSHFSVVVIGISTGGPSALQNVIPKLPANLPVPVLIVQHMPAHFTKSLAERLNAASPLTVVEATDGEAVVPGKVYIAQGGMQMLVTKNSSVKISNEDFKVLYRPCVDVLLSSVIDVYGGNVLGVIMTGMGRDGSEELKKIHAKGGYILAQDEASCVVYGMPKAVVEEGIADEILSLDAIAPAIAACLGVG